MNLLRYVAVAAVLVGCNPASATPFDFLSSVQDYALLTLNTTTQAGQVVANNVAYTKTITFSHDMGGVFPNPGSSSVLVGLVPGSVFTTSGDPEMWATMYVDNSVTIDADFSSVSGSTNPLLGPGSGTTPQGSIQYQSSPGGSLQTWEVVNNTVSLLLANAQQAALNAYNQGVGMAATDPTTSLTGTGTITGTAGINVLNLTGGINLGNGEIVTLTGPAGTRFILNVSSEFKFQTGGIRVSGGVTAGDVIINVIGAVKMTASGGGGGVAVPDLPPAYITGRVIMPDPDSEIALAPGGIYGQLFFGGTKAAFPSGGRIAGFNDYNEVPEPSYSLLMGVGLAGCYFCRRLRRRN